MERINELLAKIKEVESKLTQVDVDEIASLQAQIGALYSQIMAILEEKLPQIREITVPLYNNLCLFFLKAILLTLVLLLVPKITKRNNL